MALIPNLAWLTDNFELLRPQALHDLSASVKVCLRCGALVPGYGAAYHLNWHERNESGRDFGVGFEGPSKGGEPSPRQRL